MSSYHESIAWERAVPVYTTEFPPNSFIKITEGGATYVLSIVNAPPPDNKLGVRELTGQIIWASEAAACNVGDLLHLKFPAKVPGVLTKEVMYAAPPGQGVSNPALSAEQNAFFIVRQVHNLVRNRLPALQAKNKRIRYVPHIEIIQYLLHQGHWTASSPIDFQADLRAQPAYTTLTKRLQRLLKNYPEMFSVTMQGVRVRTDKDWAVHYMTVDGGTASKGNILVHAGTVREAFRMASEAFLTLMSAFSKVDVVER
ncbi:hypothetical protein [Microcystis phage Mvi-JY20]|uniref:Uncharacterized protein n=1 Tax=Microcystis phage Mvi-JY20 TaxID=3128146 RepID=A0AAX4QHS5_9CAUD